MQESRIDFSFQSSFEKLRIFLIMNDGSGMGVDKNAGISDEKMSLLNMDERFDDRWFRIQSTLVAILAKQDVTRRIWNERFS
jgi:hypothetical protein